MQDSLSRGFSQPDARASGGVSQFAAEVVARLVARETAETSILHESLVDEFVTAVCNPGPAAFEALKPELRRSRITAAALADVYIPAVARKLGRAWEDDSMSFAEVTIGASRLQAILREIGNGWAADSGPSAGALGTMLLIVPVGEQHTLGAMVLSGQLRRRGVSVCLRIGPDEGDLRGLLHSRRFDGAMISVACVEQVGNCRKLVHTLKRIAGNALFVAVGGALMERDLEIASWPEADIVTNDLDQALATLGLVGDTAAQAFASAGGSI